MSLSDLRRATDAGFPWAHFGARVRSAWAAELTDEFVDLVVAAAGALPPGSCLIEVARMQGAVASPQLPSCAPGRDAQFLMNYMALWPRSEDRDAALSWLTEYEPGLTRMREGRARIASFVSADEAHLGAATYGAAWDRLRRTKAAYDPANLFRQNLNVLPEC